MATTEEAEIFLGKGYVVGAERNAMRCSWADLGNDPSEFTAERIGGRSIVFTTTNGTQPFTRLGRRPSAAEIIVGAFSNLTAVAHHCQASERAVTVLASGWQNSFCIEDTLYGLRTPRQARGARRNLPTHR